MQTEIAQEERGGPGRRVAAHLALLSVVCAGLLVFSAGSLPLTDPDEARCGLIVKEMIRSGDWMVPHLEGEPYFDKPAPFFWLAAGVQLATGNIEIGGRLVAAVAGLLGVFVTYAMARRAFGPLAGLVAGLVLATSGQYFYMARWYRMDMPFAVAMWAAVWWFWRAENRAAGADEARARRGAGWYGFYGFCGLATLFKGPAGLILPVLIVLAYLLLSRQARRVVELLHPLPIALYLLIAAPWYVAIGLREPAYAYEFFLHQNLLRYTTTTFRRDWPGILYVPILLGGLLPWTIYLPGAAIRYFPRRWGRRADRPAVLMLWLAACVPVVFFALGKTHLPGYILPALPPLAVLIGAMIALWASGRQDDRLLRRGAWSMAIGVVGMGLVAAGVDVALRGADPWLALPLAWGGLAAWRMGTAIRRDERRRFLVWTFAGVIVPLLFAVGRVAPAAFDLLSTRRLAATIPAGAEAGDVFVWTSEKPSFLLYTDVPRVVALSDTGKDLRRLAKAMASDRPVYCLVSGEGSVPALREACTVPVYVLASNRTRSLVSNRPSPRQPATRPATTGPR